MDMAYVKGDTGEVVTANTLRSSLGMNVVRNCYMFDKNNLLTEIDMIGVSRKGVFVIENKHYSNLVVPDYKCNFWNVLTDNGKLKFLSPVTQNIRHVDAVNAVLDREGFCGLPVFSVVLFNDDVLLKPLWTSDEVCCSLHEFVSRYDEFFEDCDIDTETLLSKFRLYGDTSEETKKEFVDYLKKD